MAEKLEMMSSNIIQENIDYITKKFPNALKEVMENGKLVKKIDFDVLKQELSTVVIDDKQERYQMTWPDKKKSILLANSRINATLRPVKEKSVDFDNTQNLYIEGDNLDVLKLLRETYLGKVKMIYIDPPYNTGKNYIYKNNFYSNADEYKNVSGQFDDLGNLLVPNFETNGQFHTDWLNMMYQRLRVAKTLLAPDGVFVCAIDENEFSSLSLMLKEIFGEIMYEHSYVSVVHNPRGQQGVNFSYVNEYLIFIYPSDGKKYLADFPKDEVDSRNLRDSGTESDRTDAKSCFYPFHVKNGKIINIGDVPSDDFHPGNANINMPDGTIQIWPITDSGDEKKWRYARQSVDSILGKLEPKLGRSNYQIIFNKDVGTIRSVWSNARYDSSEYGTKLLDKLFGGASFTFPKSLWAVYDCVKLATKDHKDAIVLDFFSGSATTAHAVMHLNSEDDGKRKFIMVQLPENLDEALNRSSDAKTKDSIKSAINFLQSIGEKHDICSIGEERIRRAGKKIKEETGVLGQNLDVGFRVLKLDSSNMNDVFYNPNQLNQNMLDQLVGNVKEDRTPLDLLFQVVLELGIELSAKIEEKELLDKKYFVVNENDIVACFDDGINDELIKELAKIHSIYAVFKDSAFASDSANINCEQIFKSISPSTTIKVV